VNPDSRTYRRHVYSYVKPSVTADNHQLYNYKVCYLNLAILEHTKFLSIGTSTERTYVFTKLILCINKVSVINCTLCDSV
jgi:hypothetical protein